MATRLGKRSRPQHAGQSSSPVHPNKDLAGASNSVITSPPCKRLRTSIGSSVNGKENVPLSVHKVGVHDRESRTRARAIVREEAERGEEAGDDDESSEEGSNDVPPQPGECTCSCSVDTCCSSLHLQPNLNPALFECLHP